MRDFQYGSTNQQVAVKRVEGIYNMCLLNLENGSGFRENLKSQNNFDTISTCLDINGTKQEIYIDNHRQKNSQDTIKIAILAHSVIPQGDPNETTQSLASKGFSENTDSHRVQNTVHLIANHPELQQLIEAWSKLPDHIKSAIQTLIRG